MAYRLQISANEHQATVASFLETCRKQEPDLTLHPEDGLSVTTHSLTLSLFSPSLRSLLASLPPSSPLSLSVPAPFSSLLLLLKLLSEGLVITQDRQELEQVQEVAKVLGIALGDCQVGSRMQHVKEEKHLIVENKLNEDKQLDEKDHMEDEGKVKQNSRMKDHENEEKIPFKVKEKESPGSFYYSCNECGNIFKHQSNLKRHNLIHTRAFQTFSQPINLRCNQCSITFLNSKQLANHIAKEHDSKQAISKLEDNLQSEIGLPCAECDMTFQRADKLSKHIKEKHLQELSGGMKARDEQIEQMMSQSENIIRNGSTNMRKAHVCHVCGKEGISSLIKRHIEANHLEVISIPCSHCEKAFSTRNGLWLHNKKNH